MTTIVRSPASSRKIRASDVLVTAQNVARVHPVDQVREQGVAELSTDLCNEVDPMSCCGEGRTRCRCFLRGAVRASGRRAAAGGEQVIDHEHVIPPPSPDPHVGHASQVWSPRVMWQASRSRAGSFTLSSHLSCSVIAAGDS